MSIWAASDNELIIGCAVRSVLRAPRSTPLPKIPTQVNDSTRKIWVMLTVAKEGTFSASSDPCVLFPLAAGEGVPENSRLGFVTKRVALHQGSAWSNSGKALGIEEVVWENCGGSDDDARYYHSNVGRFLTEDPLGYGGGINFYSYVRSNSTNLRDPFGLRPLTPEQCRELREVFALEEKYGTFRAALKANITFNSHGILADFNSQNPDYEPVESALGPINLDWYSTLEATSGIGLAYFRYGEAKLSWVLIRLTWPGAPPVTNFIPYRAPDERNAAWQVTIWHGYKDLFPPDWMKEKCPQSCEDKK